MPHALTTAEFRAAWHRSLALSRAWWPRWVATTIVFLIVVEGLMFVPYIGFVLKLAVASLLVAQWLLMFAEADAGRPPRLAVLAGAFAWPMSSQAVLVLAGLLPFAVGIVFLAVVRGGWQGVEFFFGHMAGAAMPDPGLFLAFKLVMATAGMAMVFVPGVIVFARLTGSAALRIALRAAAVNWPVVLFSFAIEVAFEALQVALAATLPALPAAIVSIVCVVAYVTWTVAFTYTISIRALPSTATAATAASSGPADLR